MLGEMKDGGVELASGEEFSFVTTPCTGDRLKAYISYEQLPRDVSKGEKILVDDGNLVFEVVETNRRDTVKCVILNGGFL